VFHYVSALQIKQSVALWPLPHTAYSQPIEAEKRHSIAI